VIRARLTAAGDRRGRTQLRRESGFIDFRLALESFVVRSLSGNLSKEQLRALQENLSVHAKLIQKKGDQREAMVYADMAFHTLLATLLGNR
jgi:DNA-binding GntR family transcriptional regulator